MLRSQSEKNHYKSVKIGDIVEEAITFGVCRQTEKALGTVVYIHPQKRFYRVLFKQPKGTCTECYPCFICED